MAALPGLRPLVSGGQHTPIFKYLLADMRRLVSGVGNNGLSFRESRCYTVIDLIKGHAVMSEVITHRGKMWCFLLQAVPQKPAVRIVEGDLLRSPPQGRQFPVP